MPKDTSKVGAICEFVSKSSIFILVFLLPILFLPWTANVLDFNKQALLIILIIISLFFWILKTLIQGKLVLSLNVVSIPIGILLLACLISTLTSLWRYGSFWGWPFSTNESLLTVIGLVLLYFLVSSGFGKKGIFYLFIMLSLSGLLAALYGIFQFFGKFLIPLDFTKIASFNTIGSAISLGVFSAALLPFLAVIAIGAKKIITKIFCLIAVLVIAVFLILLNSPVGWWLMIAGSALVLMLVLQKRDYFDSRWLPLPMSLLIISLFFIFFRFNIPGLASRPIEVSLNQKASLGIAREILKEKPIFGSGPGTFVYDFSKYKEPGFNQELFWNVRFDSAASKMLNVLATIGLLGAIAMVLLTVAVLFYGIKFLLRKTKAPQNKEVQEPLFDGLAMGIFISILVLTIGYSLYPSNITLDFLYFLLLSGFVGLVLPEKKVFQLKPSSLVTLGATFLFTLIFIFGLGLLILGGQRYIAEINYTLGVKAWQGQNTEEALKNISRAAGFSRQTDLYWRELSQVYLQKTREEMLRKDLPQDQLNKNIQILINNSVNSAKFATDLNPKNVANWSIRGFIYQNLSGVIGGTEDWAIKAYDEAIPLEPNNPYFFYQKGNVFFGQGLLLGKEKDQEKQDNFLKAQEQFERAISLKSDYAPARFQLAMVLSSEGKTGEAIDRLEDLKKSLPEDIGVAFQLGLIYYQNKDYQKAQVELERAIAINPEYSNALYFLGLTYDQQGENQKAIQNFERAAGLNPGNQELTKILENLKNGKKALEGIVQEVPPQVPIEEKPEEKLEK